MMSDRELTLRRWRITRGIPSGCNVWFDQSCEYVKLFQLPCPDSELAAEMYVHEGLDGEGRRQYLDKVRSVSGLDSNARAVAGNEQMDLLELTDPPQGLRIEDA